MRNSVDIKIGFDVDAFRTSAQKVSRELRRSGKQMQNIGKSMSMYLTAPIVALGAVSVRNFDKQAKAIAQVEAGLKSTGGSVGILSKELQDMASELQRNSLFGDEDILKDVTAQLLTFTNITGEQFNKTQQAAIDLAARLDGDLKSASIMLGKALNDPVANLSALSRAGIQFSDEQKAMVKSLIEGGDAAGAQNLILAELEKQYGGSAKAAAEAGTGAFAQMSMALGDLTEDFGKIITQYLSPFAIKIKQIAINIKENVSPETKRWIVAIAALLAVAGPLVALIGTMKIAMAALIPIMTGINLSMAIMAIKVVLVVAALAAIAAAVYYVVENWEALKEKFGNIDWWKNAVLDMGIFLAKNNPLQAMLWGFEEILKFAGLDLNLTAPVDFIVSKLEGMKVPIKAATKELKGFGEIFKEVKSSIVGGIVPEVEGDLIKGFGGVSAIEIPVKINTESIQDISTLDLPKLEPIELEVQGNKKSMSDLVAWIDEGAFEVKMRMEKMADDISATFDRAFQALMQQGAESIGIFIGDLINGDNAVQSFGENILKAIAGFMQTLGSAMIAAAVASQTFQTMLIGSPLLALGAGIALIAASRVVSNIGSGGIDNANQNSGGGSSNFSNNFAPSPNLGGDSFTNSTRVEISGRNLILVQEREAAFRR